MTMYSRETEFTTIIRYLSHIVYFLSVTPCEIQRLAGLLLLTYFCTIDVFLAVLTPSPYFRWIGTLATRICKSLLLWFFSIGFPHKRLNFYIVFSNKVTCQMWICILQFRIFWIRPHCTPNCFQLANLLTKLFNIILRFLYNLVTRRWLSFLPFGKGKKQQHHLFTNRTINILITTIGLQSSLSLSNHVTYCVATQTDTLICQFNYTMSSAVALGHTI